MKKFILMINGPICSGKSTITELLMGKLPKTFRVSVDRAKWLISDYSKNKYRETAHRLTLELAKAAFNEGFSLIIDGNGRYSKDSNNDYKELANKTNTPFFEINLEAPIEILIDRFNKRVEGAKINHIKLSITTAEKMMESYKAYFGYKDDSNITFDSSLMGPEEICQKIMILMDTDC